MAAVPTSGKEVKYLAVARRGDKTILASRIFSAEKTYDYGANVQKVLNSPGWASVTTDKVSAVWELRRALPRPCCAPASPPPTPLPHSALPG